MKRMLKTVIALFFILSLCSMLAAASAQSDPEALQISNVTVSHDADDIVLQVTMYNAGNSAIDEFGIALAFLDENYYQLFGYADTLEGYADEICNWYYTPDNAITPGGTYETEDVFAKYSETAVVAVAIRYYYAENSGYVWLPESQWQWIYSDIDVQSVTLNREYYTSPPDSLGTAIDDFYLGYHRFYLLDDYNAYYYGKNQGGEWIIRVEPGSPAALAGLQAGDLVIFADGVKPTENIYAVEYAMAAIVAGEKVDFVYERDGVIYITRITQP
ncbi:MAG: PDZ domain-containing protein [Clostridiales bacterium]|nr:PDZ domain-containing protein [Clostridiales bacterium]